MNRYRVRLNGQNFLFNLQGKPQKYGFYTTRDVEADSFQEAKLKAVELIKDDETLKNSCVSENGDSPMVYVVEIRLLLSDEKLLENSGYTFYTEDDETS